MFSRISPGVTFATKCFIVELQFVALAYSQLGRLLLYH